MLPHLPEDGTLPGVELSSEHYFDEVVYERIRTGEALPYPGGKAVLLEFYGTAFPRGAAERLFELKCHGILPVIAHPERYRYLWQSSELLERLVASGAAALLDVGALVGKYGREPQRCAQDLLDQGLYHAACSDAHRVADIETVRAGMRFVADEYGDVAVKALFDEGPSAILAGRQPT